MAVAAATEVTVHQVVMQATVRLPQFPVWVAMEAMAEKAVMQVAAKTAVREEMVSMVITQLSLILKIFLAAMAAMEAKAAMVVIVDMEVMVAGEA